MGTRVALHKVIRLLAVRNGACSVVSPRYFGRCFLQSRFFCSSTDQATQHNQDLNSLSAKPVTELSLRSFIDMGFTDSQAGQLYDSLSTVGRGAAKHVLPTLTALFVLGLNPSRVHKVLEKCPELYTIKETLLQQRINNLRKIGLVEGSLQRVVAHYPRILTVPLKRMKHVVMFLKEKCLFTSQQVTDIIRDCPAVVLEDLDELEYKFQYVYFRMGIKQAEMVKSRLFRISLDEVRCRHTFLERRGLYETPDKKGQTIIVNPKLDSVFNVDEEAFITHVAQASAEEYDVFKRLASRERREEELQQGRIEPDSDSDSDSDSDDDDDDDSEEDEDTAGKSGYMRKRKK